MVNLEKIRFGVGVVFSLLAAYFLFIKFFYPKLMAIYHTFLLYSNNGNFNSIPLIYYGILYVVLYFMLVIAIYYLFQLRLPKLHIKVTITSVISFIAFLFIMYVLYFVYVNATVINNSIQPLYIPFILILAYSIYRFIAEKHFKGFKHRQPETSSKKNQPAPVSAGNKNVYNTPESIVFDDNQKEEYENFAWYL
ncbi:MAG: hypothetical protein ACP5T9_04085 [Thermoplasmata archaeon]